LIDCGDEDVSAVLPVIVTAHQPSPWVHALARDSDHFPVTPVQVPPNCRCDGLGSSLVEVISRNGSRNCQYLSASISQVSVVSSRCRFRVNRRCQPVGVQVLA
jgi:hypothetical protein